MTRGSSFKLGGALIVIGAALLLSGRNSPQQANQYLAEAVIQLTKPQSDDHSIGEALRTECSILESTALLDGVSSNLNLSAKWSDPNHDVSLSHIRRRLSSAIDVRLNESSEQIRVRVSAPDQSQAEEIANSVLRTYQDLRRNQLRQSKPRNIVLLEEQLEEVEPRLKLALETMERLKKDLNLEDVYQPPRNEPTLLDRIRDGKEEEPPDNNNSFYYSDPIPKDETPEHAKRRIYLRSKRVADILNLRKERIESRLEFERARNSVPETPSVQVVQAPQAVSQQSIGPPQKKGRWSYAGWGFILAGAFCIFRTPRTNALQPSPQ